MGIAVAASAASLLAYRLHAARFNSVETGIFVVDVVTFVAFLLLALRADRFWPLWITGIHLVGVATHTARLVDPRVLPWAYSVTQSLWSYPVLLLIVIGTARHQKRLKTHGHDTSWNGFFAAPGRTRQENGPIG